jgi:predicted transcriptional regulator
MAMTTLSVRLEDSEVERLDRIAQTLAERAHGARITRSNALRVTVEAGLSALEAEHGSGPKSKRPKGR